MPLSVRQQEAIQRTEAGIIDVGIDLCVWIRRNPYLVNPGETQLLDEFGPDGLTQRYSNGMPTLLKIAIGRAGGISFKDLKLLSTAASCSPDYDSVGSYFVFGQDIRSENDVTSTSQDLLVPSAVHGGEASQDRGMQQRTNCHRYASNRKTEPDKMLYKLLDDTEHPQKAYVLATCKEYVLDKDFSRFAEMMTRQLLGTNVASITNKYFCAMKSYATFKFATPITPTNCTNVLREGYHSGRSDTATLAERNAAVKAHDTMVSKARVLARRDKFICANCDCDYSIVWTPHPHLAGKHVCYSCKWHNETRGRYPTSEEALLLATQRVDVASRHPKPGSYENPYCSHIPANGKWNWDPDRRFWCCYTCYEYQKDNEGALRIPTIRHRRTASEKGLPCANPLCRDKTAKHWDWSQEYEAFVCSPCSMVYRRMGSYPDRLTTRTCTNPLCCATKAKLWRRSKETDAWVCSPCFRYHERRNFWPDRTSGKPPR